MGDEPARVMCCETKFAGFGYPAKRCKNAAKVERDGKPYCGVHDPERLEAKREERTEKWKAEAEAHCRARSRRLLEFEVCDGVSDADLRRVIEAGGLAAMLAKGGGA